MKYSQTIIYLSNVSKNKTVRHKADVQLLYVKKSHNSLKYMVSMFFSWRGLTGNFWCSKCQFCCNIIAFITPLH